MSTLIGFSPRFRVLPLVLVTTAILMAGFSLPASAASGLFDSMTPELEPTLASGDYYGYAVSNGTAVSADGLTALVAATYATVGTTSNAGKAYIYHFANGEWDFAREIDDPDAAAGHEDEFGAALALNADGTVAIIGSYAYVNGQAYAGKAYVYTLSNGSWTQTKEFDDPAATEYDYFGACSVGLAADGKTAAISGCYTVFYIFTESNGSWTQAPTIPAPADGPYDFGYPVAISGDGKSVLVGSEASVGGQDYAGKAYLYTLLNGSWTQSHEFVDPVATAEDEFGHAGLALSADGQTAVIGADGTTVNGNQDAGEGYIFTESNGSWPQAAAIPDPDNDEYDYFAYPVTISADGKSALFGSYASISTTLHAGKAYLYTAQSNGSWTQAKEFDDPGVAAGDEDAFGDSGVALSSDGEMAFISASGTRVNGLSGAGVAYIYQSPDDLSLALTATPTSIATGQSVAFDATVTNTDSAVTANYVTLTATLPAGLSFANGNAAGGSCSASGQSVICTLASLAPGADWQPSIMLTASMLTASNTGSFTANANVTSNEPDPSSTNNSASASVTVTAASGSSSSGSGALGLLSLLTLGLSFLSRRRRN